MLLTFAQSKFIFAKKLDILNLVTFCLLMKMMLFLFSRVLGFLVTNFSLLYNTHGYEKPYLLIFLDELVFYYVFNGDLSFMFVILLSEA